jgi:hypothetical protein
MTLADACCAVVFRRGGSARWIAVIVALPSLWILGEFLRRAPGVWGLG